MEETMSTASRTTCDALTYRLRQVIKLHLDPKNGTPYWLERERELRIDVRKEVRFLEDLPLLGPMDSAALASRCIEDFIPSCMLARKSEILIAETAGTLGRPKFAGHREDEFDLAFIKPFVVGAQRVNFPRELNWLFAGPSGPHVIAKAAQRCARAMGSPDPFSIDLDPRWAKKLVPGSFAAQRYLEHIEEQALRVMQTQQIGVIFASPAVLDGLSEKITPEIAGRIRGLHLGGMAVSTQSRQKWSRVFPQAVILSGYGNSLFGMMPELHYSDETGIDYYPHGNRLVVELVAYNPQDTHQGLGKTVELGERGQVVLHRLDELQFIPNMVERDTAIRIAPREGFAADGFVQDGLRDPQPITDDNTKPVLGLY